MINKNLTSSIPNDKLAVDSILRNVLLTLSTLPPHAAPCPPQNVVALAGCDNRTVSVNWMASAGALTYTATLEGTDGETTCCTTDGTGCDISDLPCGEMYVLLVTAEGRTCNSSQSQGMMVRTGREHAQLHMHATYAYSMRACTDTHARHVL